MRRIYIILMLLMAFAATVVAQHENKSLSLQPKIGLNLSRLTEHFDSNFKPGLVAGLEAEYQSTQRFSWILGAYYSQQGAKYSLSEYQYAYNFDYVNVPLIANIYLVRNLALKVGMQMCFNVRNNYTITSPKTKESRTEPDLKAVGVGALVGLSYEIRPFVIEARYSFGPSYASSDSKFSTLQFTLGYRFDVVKGK